MVPRAEPERDKKDQHLGGRHGRGRPGQSAWGCLTCSVLSAYAHFDRAEAQPRCRPQRPACMRPTMLWEHWLISTCEHLRGQDCGCFLSALTSEPFCTVPGRALYRHFPPSLVQVPHEISFASPIHPTALASVPPSALGANTPFGPQSGQHPVAFSLLVPTLCVMLQRARKKHIGRSGMLASAS